MKFLLTFIGTIAITHSAVFPPNHQVNIPVEKTSILGPSGSIIQIKYLISGGNRKNFHVLNIPAEITNIVGPSGAIKQEKYLRFPTTSKSLPEYVPSIVNEVTSELVNIPVEKTSIVGPSDTIIEEKNYSSVIQIDATRKNHSEKSTLVTDEIPSLSQNEDCVEKNEIIHTLNNILGQRGLNKKEQQSHEKFDENTSKTNQSVNTNFILHLKSPILVQYKFPTNNRIDVFHGSNIESKPPVRTSRRETSGSIIQNIQLDANKYSAEGHNILTINPTVLNPGIVNYVLSPIQNVVAPRENNVVSKTSEKTSIIGASGSITQVFHSNPNEYSSDIRDAVKNFPATSNQVAVPYASLSVENLTIPPGSKSVSASIEKTSIIGPSGSITKEFRTSGNKPTVRIHNIVNTVKNTPVIAHINSGIIENYFKNQEAHVVSKSTDKTSVIGSSGLSSQEKYSQSTTLDQGIKLVDTIKATPVIVQSTSPVDFPYEAPPSLQIYALAQEDNISSIPKKDSSIVEASGSFINGRYSLPTEYNDSSTQRQESNTSGLGFVVIPPNSLAQLHYGSATYSSVSSPTSILREVSASENAKEGYESNGVDHVVEKTSIVGPSGLITQEYNPKSILTHVAEVGDISPTEKMVVQYSFNKHSAPGIASTDADINVQNFGPYAPIPKYPNIVAPQC